MDSFRLQPEHFPKATQDWLELDWILASGMLPLGTKQGYRLGVLRATFANVGCLRPWNRAQIDEVRRHLPQVDGVRFYEVRPEPFWEIVRTNYPFDTRMQKPLSDQALHPALRPFLDTV